MKTTTSAWALVSGASGGIGREFARQLARSGWNLVLVSRGREKLEALRAELLAERADPAFRVEVLPADLSQPGTAAAVHQACAGKGIAVELLVNNAGAGMFAPIVECDPAAMENMLQLNVQSLTSMCILFGRDMAERGHGSILNVGSFAGNQATPYFAPYAASKSYVLQFSLAIREELAAKGVRVTCLEPGYVSTDFDANAGIVNPKYLKFSEANSLPAATVARVGLRAMARNKAWRIPGLANRIGAAFFGILPATLPPKIMKSFVDGMKREGK
jgi:short-subunit dehydrogenase